jgi:hypothetical protein
MAALFNALRKKRVIAFVAVALIVVLIAFAVS